MVRDNSEPLYALSIRQPYAWAIVEGWKDVENRSWSTKRRGTIAVHASTNFPRVDYEDFVTETWELIRSQVASNTAPAYEDFPLGAFVGLVDIVDCVERHRSLWFDGPFGFVLANPRTLREPIPYKGALNFWKVPDAIADRIAADSRRSGAAGG